MILLGIMMCWDGVLTQYTSPLIIHSFSMWRSGADSLVTCLWAQRLALQSSPQRRASLLRPHSAPASRLTQG